ncbi:thyrotropin-releasing hormone receptor-like [Homarus americanus]|uniref:thyrotropin-releasing hormone receptor-like n=1 Tax=Homarus americanus TaxID=6706 RepID=UPI001C438D80|nr:thyrotropin-releasing hormone receptor-like [Homarus americanus]
MNAFKGHEWHIKPGKPKNVSGDIILISCTETIKAHHDEDVEEPHLPHHHHQQHDDVYDISDIYDYEHYNFTDEQWGIVRQLNMYYVPLLIVVGFVGNLLSCVVFLNTRLRMRSSSYYLAALAIADVTYLFILFLVWLDLLGFNTFNVNVMCQLEIYLGSVSSSLSVWLTVAFTVERFIAVQYPLQRPTVCTVHRAKTIIMLLSGFSVTVHLYVFVTAGVIVHQDERDPKCNLRMDYRGLMNVINWIDTLLTLVIPFIMIVVMNTLIARQLIKFSRRFRHRDDFLHLQEVSGGQANGHHKQGRTSSQSGRSPCPSSGRSVNRISTKHHVSQPAASSSSSTTKNNNNLKMAMPFTSSAATVLPYPSKNPRSILSTRTQYSITKMLLLISTVFILLNLPSHVIRVHAFLTSLWGNDLDSDEVTMWNLQQLFMQLQYTHFSINFVFYSTCGATFRKCLFQLLPMRLRTCCCRKSTNSQRYQ